MIFGPLVLSLPPGEALVILVPKPGKDPLNPNNYRPVAITSCLCIKMKELELI